MTNIIEINLKHKNEIKKLRDNCNHNKLIKRVDDSVIGRGTIYPRVDIVCQICGVKKIVFDEKNIDNIKLTLKMQGLKDERMSQISYDYELEEQK